MPMPKPPKPEMAAPPRVIRPLPPSVSPGPGNVRPLPPPKMGQGNVAQPFLGKKSVAFGGMKSGGAVSASKRADGIAKRGHTKGKMV